MSIVTTIVDYTILDGDNSGELSLMVRNLLSKGWELRGDIQATETRFGVHLYQAMVKIKREVLE